MRSKSAWMRQFIVFPVILPGLALTARAQTADLSGVIKDSSMSVVPRATITATHEGMGVKRTTVSDFQGLYRLSFLAPGAYTIVVEASGFGPESRSALKLDAGQDGKLDFILAPAALRQNVVVAARASSLQTDSGTVGTEVDREFVENLPLNGRTIQSLIALVPGVVATGPTPSGGGGQFSVNGQRDSSNYVTVDGVSGNVGGGSVLGGTPIVPTGTIPGFNIFGGTNNLISVDAMQEFKLQTSTYSAEFGRAAGGQLQIVTRSGSNAFHGDAFDYFRNDALDANYWFPNANGLPKAAMRQNDFGGDFGGPILKNRTFFFFAYEGLRLRLPEFQQALVPSLGARQAATGAIQQLLNAFPLPNGPEDPAALLATFAANYSIPTSSDTASLRIDQVVNKSLVVFGRYSEARSNHQQRNNGSDLATSIRNLRSLTGGGTLVINPRITNQVRINYTGNRGDTSRILDRFGGAVPPPDSLLFPAAFASPDSSEFFISTGFTFLFVGQNGQILQRQGNLIDNTSVDLGSHQVRFGIDYRYLSPRYAPPDYSQFVFFDSLPQMLTGVASRARITSNDPVTLAFHTLSLYGEDSWKATPRLTVTYGLRWELAPPPVAQGGQRLFTLAHLDIIPDLQLASPGTPLYHTTLDNFAPRLGIAYQLSSHSGRETVLRGGLGVYYDLGYGEVGDAAASFPHTRFATSSGVAYPLNSSVGAPPPLLNLDPPYSAPFHAFDPGHELPRTYEWNFTVDQKLGSQQTLSASYVAALGRGLLRRTRLTDPNPRFVGSVVYITTDDSSSQYQALQVRFQRRLTRGLAALLSYTWSHSIDNNSSDTGFDHLLNPQLDRGSSDFDVRHNFHAAFTYSIPQAPVTPFLRRLLRNWALDTTVTAQAGFPTDVFYYGPPDPTPETNVARPDLVPGVPVYISDPNAPGGWRLNPAAFQIAPAGREGTLGRNALRGFPLFQTDFAIRRRFDLGDKLKLQARVEFFNLFNHSNFSNPAGYLGDFGPPFTPNPFFGMAGTMSGGQGALAPLYDVGGPRSIQISLRLSF